MKYTIKGAAELVKYVEAYWLDDGLTMYVQVGSSIKNLDIMTCSEYPTEGPRKIGVLFIAEKTNKNATVLLIPETKTEKALFRNPLQGIIGRHYGAQFVLVAERYEPWTRVNMRKEKG